jgi:hypothetical protein
MITPPHPLFRYCGLAALLAVASVSPAAVLAQTAPVAAERKVITPDDFRRVLTSNLWTWERANNGPAELRFSLDGTARHPNFVLKYRIKNLREVEIGSSKGKATLTFAEDYMSYEGRDFVKQRPIHGRRK